MSGVESAFLAVIGLLGFYVGICLWQLETSQGVVNTFGPPEGFTPGEIGFLERGYFSLDLMVAELTYLESLGFVAIKPEGNSFIVRQVKAVDPELPDCLKVLMETLFASDPTFIMAPFNRERLGVAMQALVMQYRYSYQTFHRRHKRLTGICFFLGGVGIIAPLTSVWHNVADLQNYLVSVAIGAFGFFMLKRLTETRMGLLLHGLFFKMLLLAITLSLFAYFHHWGVLAMCLINCALFGVAYLLYYACQIPTKEGRYLLKAMNGFKEYLPRIDNSQAYISMGDLEHEFCRLVPYAIVLGKVKSFVTKYRNLYRAMPDKELSDPSYFARRIQRDARLAECCEDLYVRRIGPWRRLKVHILA